MALAPELFTALARHVGSSLPIDVAPHYAFASSDTVRIFAHSSGDANPRWHHEAPPLFPLATGTPVDTPVAAELVELWRAVRRGAPRIVEDRWRFEQAIPLGARLSRVDELAAVVTGEPTTVTVRSRYFDDRTLYAVHERDREFGRDEPVPPRRERAHYTPDQIEAIVAQYGAHRTRRSTTDTELGPLVKGPLTVTDLVAYRGGVGPGPFGVGALELDHANRLRRPHFYDRADTGMFEARERLHYDESYAQMKGHPGAYDYSHTRLVWASQLITDWLDDAHRLRSLAYRELGPNYVGDTHWLTGRVIARDGDVATIAYEARNQLDQVTADGTATVSVPADRGPAS